MRLHSSLLRSKTRKRLQVFSVPLLDRLESKLSILASTLSVRGSIPRIVSSCSEEEVGEGPGLVTPDPWIPRARPLPSDIRWECDS